MTLLSKKEVLDKFPAKKFRKYQREAIEKMVDAFNSGVKCILLEAPTGFGKSIVNTTFCRAMTPAFYTTPQLSLIDQIIKDKIIGKFFVEIKGRQNYRCTYDPTASVDVGLCRRVKDFECRKTEVCPYWRQKVRALNAPIALMSFAYFMLEGRTETEYSFGRRRLLVLDEAHSIDKYIVSHVSFIISPYTVPFEFYKSIEKLITDFRNDYEVVAFVKTALEYARATYDKYVQLTLTGEELSVTDAYDYALIENFISMAETFLNSAEYAEWVWDLGWSSYMGKNYKKFIAQPVYARIFAADMVWSRADYYIVSSATILDPKIYVFETGLDKVLKMDEILHLQIPSTFPAENRPIIDVTNGRLTYNERTKNFPIAVKILEKIIELEKGRNIAVHCHSYDMMIGIENLIDPKYKPLLVTHTPATRQEALEKWKNSRGKVFLCVSFEEGQDWVGDICEAQVLFKVPYGDIKDKRIHKRLTEKKDWKWYRNEALKTVIQAYGRAVRTPEDKAAFYVIDSSFVDLIRRCRKNLPDWFKEALPEHWKKLVEVK